MKKGIIHLIPLVAIAAVISIASIGFIGAQRNYDTIQGGSILASSKANENSQKPKTDNSQGKKPVNPGKSQSDSDQKSEDKSLNSTSQNQGGSNSNSRGRNADFKNTVEELIEESADIGESEDTTQTETEGTPSASSGRKIRTNFPITVNPETNEKFVTTPSGTKVVILPEVAIQNMIKAGFPVILPEPEPEPSPTPEGTPSATISADVTATSEDESAITLTEVDDELVYEIPAIQQQQFLGLFDVNIEVTGQVSAVTGEIVNIEKSLFDTILDLLSF